MSEVCAINLEVNFSDRNFIEVVQLPLYVYFNLHHTYSNSQIME